MLPGRCCGQRIFGTIGDDTFADIIGYDITTDASDNLYITGNFSGTYCFWGLPLLALRSRETVLC